MDFNFKKYASDAIFSSSSLDYMLTSSRVYREIVKSHFECIAADDVYRTGRGLNVGFDLKKKINSLIVKFKLSSVSSCQYL